MASHFEIVDNEYIKELMDESENEDTKNSTEWWENVFKKWKETWKQIKKSTRTMSLTKDYTWKKRGISSKTKEEKPHWPSRKRVSSPRLTWKRPPVIQLAMQRYSVETDKANQQSMTDLKRPRAWEDYLAAHDWPK